MPRRPIRIRIAAAALLGALAVGGLAGCTAAGGSSTSAAGSSGGGSAARTFSSDEKAAAQPASADRSVVTTGVLDLVAHDPAAAADRIETLVTAARGGVQRSTQSPTGHGGATLVVRIPAAVFATTLTRIEHEGRVRTERIEAADVTGAVTDTAVRITTLRTSIARLQKLLATADSTADLVSLEGALTDRQTSLEQLLGQQRTLADQVAAATLTVDIVAPSAVPATGPADFAGGFAAGLAGLVRTAAASAVVLGVLAPWLIVLAVLGGAVTVVVRALRRRRAGAVAAG